MWRIEYQPDERRLTLQLSKHVAPPEMRTLGRAHARALEATGGDPFRVLMDLRGLYPLDGESAEILTDMKRVASSLTGYQARAVLVDSATIAMQQRNATLEDGDDGSELVTWSPDEAIAHLSKVDLRA
ncbi:MAG: hypothetical protein AB8I08_24475 [Sandaracinaceae bacterium]